MISGVISIALAFITAAVSMAAYGLYYKNQDERFLYLANRMFYFMGAAVIFASLLLYFNIFTHNFQLNYVYSYTARRLTTYYLISAFWAGQEGTFLLWLVFGTIYGIILIRKTARKNPLVMLFLVSVQLFILLILLKKNPFAYIWQVHSEAPVGFTPADGSGLNPLLENPWMVVHPPVMFVGYSSTVVAFAYAMSAMIRKQFQDWVKPARPWILFSVLSLGAGIILGGYWSYVTLGWGGYWAWDPVENASLVPWIMSAVLLHGVIIQIRQKGLVKTNLFLAGGTFVAVLWGTFLTRSGVLTDFSVHSFGESGLNIYLVAFVLLYVGLFLYYFFRSYREIESNRFAEGIFSRETFILIGMMALLFTAVVVFLATSSPIYTDFFGQPSNVSIDFYNKISIPVAIFMLFSMALAPLLAWKVSELRDLKSISISAIAALIVTVVSFILGMNKPISLFLTFLSAAVIFLNGIVIVRLLRKVPTRAGAYLTHVGIGFMIIGIITSSVYDDHEKVTLPMGEFRQTKFGYEVQFEKFVKMPDGKDRVMVLVKTPNGVYEADPQFYYSDFTKSYMVSPHVKMGFVKDIYISPISYMPAKLEDENKMNLLKNEEKQFSDLNIKFNRFIVGGHADGGHMKVKADLTVSYQKDGATQKVNLQPALWMENGEMRGDEVAIPGTDYKVRLTALDANTGMIQLDILSPNPKQKTARDMLAIEISEKPLISLLWLGTVLMLVGMFISLIDRIKPKEA